MSAWVTGSGLGVNQTWPSAYLLVVIRSVSPFRPRLSAWQGEHLHVRGLEIPENQ